MTHFEINADIRKARTLPSGFYTDERWFVDSKEKIFARCWHLVGGPELGSGLTPVTMLPGFLDEPILISDAEGVRRCFSNVCTHRGKILVDEPCTVGLIRCRYHGRRFSLDGKFLSMPEFEGVEDFPSASDDLSPIAFAERAGFRFSALAPFAPLLDFMAEAKSCFDGVEPEKLRLLSIRDYTVNAHWALYCENYLEGFHIPYVHRSLNDVVDYGSYTTETFRFCSLQTGFDNDGGIAGRYFFLFPNTMFNFYPWGISVNVVKPLTPSTSVISYLTYVSDESNLGTGAGADLDRVELEDEAVVESVQKGIRSRFYSSGRYSPTREQGTHHFHRLIAEFMM